MIKGFSVHINREKVSVKSFMPTQYFDSFHFSNEELEIVIEGVILNKKSLISKFSESNVKELFRKIYQSKNRQFLNELEGEYRGFIYDKECKKVWVFTNATSTQKVFFCKNSSGIFIDTSLKRLTENLSSFRIPFKIDQEAMYQLLCFTNLLEGKTPIEGVEKLLDGSFLEINVVDESFTSNTYFSVEKVERFSGSKTQAIDRIHECFSEAIKLEYEKDEELEKDHFSLLSGGLDSRVAVLYAQKLQQNPKKVFCFSQSGYLDETISRKIAKKYHLEYDFVSLDEGNYLIQVDEITNASDGCGIFTGGVHVNYAINKLANKDIGLIHGGQIGDGVLGGFNSVPYQKKPSHQKIVVNPTFLPKVSENLEKVFSNYEREELFYLRNIAFNRTVLGAQVFQEFSYQTSPFMTKDFMSFAISLPESWKHNHHFYIDWIKKHCKEATEFSWERTMMRPNAKWKTKVGDRFNKRIANLFYHKILGKEYRVSMYPYQFYFDDNIEIQRFYQNYFDENIHLLEEYKELREDVISLFQKKDFFSKSSALNIIAVFKYYYS